MIDFRKKNKKKAKVKVEGGNCQDLDLDTPDIPNIDDSTRYTVLQLINK